LFIYLFSNFILKFLQKGGLVGGGGFTNGFLVGWSECFVGGLLVFYA